jgi:predicted DNA-binding ribbon-helix-helix protein
MSLGKPQPINKSAAALAFAESKPEQTASTATTAEKRVFYAPEGYRRLTINLEEGMHKKLRLMAVEQDCTVTDIIVGLVSKALDK